MKILVATEKPFAAEAVNGNKDKTIIAQINTEINFFISVSSR